MPTEITCPRCRGAGATDALVDRRGPDDELVGSFERMPCRVCAGAGSVTAEHAERIAAGRRHHDARVARRESLKECAPRYGCTPAQLSAYETSGAPLPDGSRPTGER